MVYEVYRKEIMKYRIEYTLVGAESIGLGKKEFDESTDNEALLKFQIFQKEASEHNKGTGFGDLDIKDPQLFRIDQPEIRTKLA